MIYMEGKKKVIDIVEEQVRSMQTEIFKKISVVSDKVSSSVVESDTLKRLSKEAVDAGFINQATLDQVKENAELMSKDPQAIMALGGQIAEIAKDPQKFMQDTEQKIIESIKVKIQEKIDTQFTAEEKELVKPLSELVFFAIKKEKENMKLNFKPFLIKLTNFLAIKTANAQD